MLLGHVTLSQPTNFYENEQGKVPKHWSPLYNLSYSHVLSTPPPLTRCCSWFCRKGPLVHQRARRGWDSHPTGWTASRLPGRWA